MNEFRKEKGYLEEMVDEQGCGGLRIF